MAESAREYNLGRKISLSQYEGGIFFLKNCYLLFVLFTEIL